MVKGKGGGAPTKDQAPKNGKGAKGKTDAELLADAAKKAEQKQDAAKANVLTEDQQRAIFFNHKTLYERDLAKKKEADAAFRNTCKLIKSEGTAISDIKDAITLDDREGEIAIRAQIERRLQVARWVGADFGHQFSLLPETPAVDRAFEEGKIAGLKGTPKKPPHDPSVPQYKRWMEGYDQGQAVLAKKFEPKPVAPPKPPKADNVVALKPADAKAPEAVH